MVAWLRPTQERRLRPALAPVCVRGLWLMEVSLPPGKRERRLRQAARLLGRQGIRRIIPPEGWEDEGGFERWGLSAVNPLPLCRRKGDELALCLLSHLPPQQRRVALRGGAAGNEAWVLAQGLCPWVKALSLDFERGEEALARRLREAYGVAPVHLGWGQEPQVSIELEPRPNPAGKVIRLWGKPDLGGLVLKGEGTLPEGMDSLLFLELLWETGRLTAKEIRAEWP